MAKPGLRAALAVAVVVLAFELLTLACLRWHFFDTGFVRSMASATLGGAISAALGSAAG